MCISMLSKRSTGEKELLSAEKRFSEASRNKKIAHPLKIRGGIQKYSTVPPWLQIALPLIDAVTGAPESAFPPVSSEVVSLE